MGEEDCSKARLCSMIERRTPVDDAASGIEAEDIDVGGEQTVNQTIVNIGVGCGEAQHKGVCGRIDHDRCVAVTCSTRTGPIPSPVLAARLHIESRCVVVGIEDGELGYGRERGKYVVTTFCLKLATTQSYVLDSAISRWLFTYVQMIVS